MAGQRNGTLYTTQVMDFSKDDKSKQPKIVIGLLVAPEGFALMHEAN